MRPWHLGNTTVRSPFRLRDGLVALSTSPIQGNLRGRDQEIALRNLLGEHGIVELGEDISYSVGRKWRSALNKLGFLYSEIPSRSGVAQGDMGAVDTITPNGWRLIRADTVPAMQECFLRALAAYYIPSPLEEEYPFTRFSPLRHTLAVMLELERRTGESRLNFIEMGLVVQLSSTDDGVAEVATRVLDLRQRREQSDNKRRFDHQELDAAAEVHQYRATTFNDYADTNFRYLKATGLVQSRGRGVSLTLEKHVLVERLVADASVPDSDQAYFVALASGATLPTDNRDEALIVLDDLLAQLRRRGIAFAASELPRATTADIGIIRHQAEALLLERNEEEFADRQASEWEEIAAYMDLISTRSRRKTLVNGEEISIPQTEVPAYFEWVLWRAFLAINSLSNRPYEARRFKIDQDFLPIGCAPGNGPDLIFEFENYVLVVEVTLTDSSRQEAVEGEPVRRHVAELLTEHRTRTGKPVYGLFIANRIDSNTAETFRIGAWYDRDDVRLRLDILPFTLEQFKALFTSLFEHRRVDVQTIRELLDRCSDLRPAHEAPAWKQQIGTLIQRHIQQLGNQPLN